MGELGRLFKAELERDWEAGVEAVEAKVKALAPVDTGTLRKSIQASIDGFLACIETTTGEDYPEILDAGSGPYVIRARTAGALFWEGAEHPVREVNHPGSTKHKGWWDDALAEGMREFDKVVGC